MIFFISSSVHYHYLNSNDLFCSTNDSLKRKLFRNIDNSQLSSFSRTGRNIYVQSIHEDQ